MFFLGFGDACWCFPPSFINLFGALTDALFFHSGVILTPLTNLDTSDAKEGQAEWNKLAPLGRVGQAEEVAEVIAWLLSDNSSYITGMIHEVDGGIMA